MMNEQNEIVQHIKSAFESFEADPPVETWDKIQQRMNKPGFFHGMGEQWILMIHWLRSPVHGYPVLAGLSVLLVILFVWIGMDETHHISGHAFAGNEKLSAGTAYLLHLQDKIKPIDSVRVIQKTSLDSTGRFEFHDIPSGIYMIRINVSPESPLYIDYKYGYFGNQLCWDQAEKIIVNGANEDYQVLLPPMPSQEMH